MHKTHVTHARGVKAYLALILSAGVSVFVFDFSFAVACRLNFHEHKQYMHIRHSGILLASAKTPIRSQRIRALLWTHRCTIEPWNKNDQLIYCIVSSIVAHADKFLIK